MTGEHTAYRWAALFGALLLCIGVGIAAYNTGLSHGLAQASIAAPAPGAAAPAPAPYPYVYGWHPFWMWGGFSFFPLLFFVLFWIFICRLLWWGGWRRGYYGCAPYGWYGRRWDATHDAFDDWHRRAHDEMNHPKETGSGNDPGRGR